MSSSQKVSDDYLRVFRVPLLRGRFFTTSDTVGSQPVLVVNEQFAAKYSPGRDVIGTRLSRNGKIFEVIGVVADGRFNYYQKPKPFVLMSTNQEDTSVAKLAVRTIGDPDDFARPQREGDILQNNRGFVLDSSGPTEMTHFEDRRWRSTGKCFDAPLCFLGPKEIAQGTSDHEPDDAIGRGLRNVEFADGLAVPQYRHAITNSKDLLKAVGDVDDGETSFLQPANDVE